MKANVGGVGIAMVLLIAARAWLAGHGRLSRGVRLGVGFWGGAMIRDFAIVATAFEVDVAEARSAA